MYGHGLAGGDGPPGIREQVRTRCSDCPQRLHCLPAKLEGAALAEFERELIHLPTLVKGGTLVTEGEPFEAFYAVKRGILKAVRCDSNNDGQVTAFHFPGTVLGLGERETRVWTASQVALTDAWVCRIPPGLASGALQRWVSQLASAVLRAEYEYHLALAERGAGQRLATSLVHLCEAMGSPHLPLPIGRADLASYLGISQETLGRRLRELTRCGWITTDSTDIEIRDLGGLRRFADG